MPRSVPPSDGSSPPHHKPPVHPSDKSSSAFTSGPKIGSKGASETMTEFMKLFTPEQRKKFMNIMIQNFVGVMQKEGKKIEERLKKERANIESGRGEGDTD